MSRKTAVERSRKEKVDEAIQTLLTTLSDKAVEKRLISDSEASVRINPQEIHEVATIVKNNLDSTIGETVVGVDLLNRRYELIYYFWSLTKKVMIEIRTQVEGGNPSIDSVSNVFPGLDWHEREIHEMFGIKFNGHPNLSLLILPDELKGQYPLRKSFQVSRERLKESGIITPISRTAKTPAPSASTAGDKPSGSELEGKGR